MKKALDWVKANVLVVALGAVALAALGFGWFFADTLNESVQKTAKDKVAKMNDLMALEKSPIKLEIPGREPVTRAVVINEELLNEYRKIAEDLKSDAGKIREMALARNRGNHKVALEGVFPTFPSSQKERIPFDLQAKLDAAYKKLFPDINAGMPPPPEQVVDDLARRESQYIESTLRKANRESLDEQEKKDLREELGRNRLAIYVEQAQKLTVYAAPSAVQIPLPPGKKETSAAEMFDWQWRYWVVSDILHAVVDASAAANGGTPGSVLKSPVKRIISITIDPADFIAPAGGNPGGEGGGAGFGVSGAGFGSAGAPASDATGAPVGEGAAAAAPAANAPLGPPQVDMTTEAARDYSKSLTGHVRSSAFDVRKATVNAVIATRDLPKFFDALAKRNFITVTNVRIDKADPFDDAASGFVYGRDPVSRVTLDLESVWLREWLAPLMPPDVRTALQIQNQSPAGDAAQPPSKPAPG